MSVQVVVPFVQRCHWYANVLTAPPEYLPGVATSFAPTAGLPTMVGFVLLVGGRAGVIASVGFELTGPAVPPALVAVTHAASAWFTSADVGLYVFDVAPEIWLQPLPFWSHRTHW